MNPVAICGFDRAVWVIKKVFNHKDEAADQEEDGGGP